jgi:hypothetical protein
MPGRHRRLIVFGAAITVLAFSSLLAARSLFASIDTERGPDGFRRALSLTPTDPNVHVQFALEQARSAASPEDARWALLHAVNALRLRPVSPYGWADLAEVKYRADVADATFQAALQRATYLGPHEPAVQEAVVFYGLAIWDEATPESRTAVERMLTSGLKRDPATMMQIAQRRGRLHLACRYLDPTSRISGNWAQLCKRSAEAK